MELSEELELELEALRATYGEEGVQLTASAPGGSGSAGGDAPARARVAVAVGPAAAAAHQQYVGGTLVMEVGADYPASGPSLVALHEAKGLGDAWLGTIQAALRAEAELLAGELLLGHLVHTAIDLLTEANAPEGDCAFCLESLEATSSSGTGRGGGSADDGSLLRLDCFHVFHMACFAPWWDWQQRQLAGRERQLCAEYKAIAGEKLAEEGIEADTQGVYTVLCPACRASVPAAALQHARPALAAARAEAWSSGPAGASHRVQLEAGALQRLRAMQARNGQAYRRQQQQGGLVDVGVAVSVADLQAAAAESRAAAAAASATVATAAAAADKPRAAAGAAAGEQAAGQQQQGRGRVSGRQLGRGRHAAQGRSASGRGRGGPPPPGCVGDTPSRLAAEQLGGMGLRDPKQQHQPQQQQHQPQQRHGPGSGARGGGRGGRGGGRGGGRPGQQQTPQQHHPAPAGPI